MFVSICIFVPTTPYRPADHAHPIIFNLLAFVAMRLLLRPDPTYFADYFLILLFDVFAL